MVQIPGSLNGRDAGITTLELHEDSTWSTVSGAGAAPAKPLTLDQATLIAYIKRLRDRRKEN